MLAVAKKVKAILATIEKFSGEKKDHAKYIDDIETAFTNNGMRHIVTSKALKWDKYKEDHRALSRIQNKTMLSVLQATLSRGAAYTKYREAKRKHGTNSRFLFTAVRTRLTRCM